jgi:hypothetical protein
MANFTTRFIKEESFGLKLPQDECQKMLLDKVFNVNADMCSHYVNLLRRIKLSLLSYSSCLKTTIAGVNPIKSLTTLDLHTLFEYGNMLSLRKY